jgi:hypothetical protein
MVVMCCYNPITQAEARGSRVQSQPGAGTVVHAYNSSYSGGRYQEDCSSKPAQANSLRDPILKKTLTKRAGGMPEGVGRL